MKNLPGDNPSLVREQYKNRNNLQVRIDTHIKFTQPKRDFISFVLDQVSWTGQETVIDVGCGAGAYIEEARNRAGRYLACDLSIGMLLSLTAHNLPRVNLDIQQLPFAGRSADVVLANHMLYHVPDQDSAVAEIRRVLRPGGYLLAATNSGSNMPELARLRQLIARNLGLDSSSGFSSPVLSFTLESGHDLLGRHFETVSRVDLPSALVFPDSQPVIDYINSSRSYYESLIPDGFNWEELETMLHHEVTGQIAEQGEFRVNKLTGVFVCRKDQRQ